MISRNLAKYIKSLQIKKYRKETQSFFVEGAKNVIELINSEYEITHLCCTEEFLEQHKTEIKLQQINHFIAKEKDLVQIGTFKNNNAALAVAKITETPIKLDKKQLYLALDDVRDPGNMGTIIRIADWYGIKNIIASQTCADLYNPKVLNASMGSFIRVNVEYANLSEKLQGLDMPIYGALLEGANIHKKTLEPRGVILMGNESNGISQENLALVNSPITIPNFGGAESLNVAIATAVICDNFRRY
ncbi:TrmH family RNA methyltransferase [Aureibacter tunicatorum]|uniref:TrmH family RNA methyltransferase n=1 Tax=Aureibacter tunicatorum TaxID=866807 RepID=A0AAE3XPS3_9BACT|nr:RNA methyltransferase [Aureibacter tunicatorum]MDR6239716.1 TrmH family RNA methyltransferase [Aureibacter tunicatorum]BDD04192.1 RNA methyltransferase [Aureibacter tunicatorum]